jgi:GNAT superfamily N-acetyltransferase
VLNCAAFIVGLLKKIILQIDIGFENLPPIKPPRGIANSAGQHHSIMSIDIEILTGATSWPIAQPLLDAAWPTDDSPRQGPAFAGADLRVLLEDESGLACHVGIHWRDATWNDRKVRIGGIGAIATRPDCRRRGYASVALNAATQTLKDERATDFALLFCEPQQAAFYQERRWRAFTGDIRMEPQQPGGRDARLPYVFDLRRAPREGILDLCGSPW